MENRPFDHMLGALHTHNPNIDGLTRAESNPDTTGSRASVQPLAEYQSQLDPDPNHEFSAVDLQILTAKPAPTASPTCRASSPATSQKQRNVAHSHKILYYFTPDKLPVLCNLATEFAVFNRWFSSIPGPTICNRAFAH